MYQVNNATEDTSNRIAYLHKQVESLSCELRCALEEIADLMYQEDIELTECVPHTQEPSESVESYDVQDWANQVSEIEDFFMDCD